MDVLDELYLEYGYYENKLISLTLEGIEGQARIARIMEDFRTNPLEKISEMNLVNKIDFLIDETGNPKSNVLKYYFDDGSWYAVRPSGTEPKIKIYIYTRDDEKEIAIKKIDLIEQIVDEKMSKVD